MQVSKGSIPFLGTNIFREERREKREERKKITKFSFVRFFDRVVDWFGGEAGLFWGVFFDGGREFVYSVSVGVGDSAGGVFGGARGDGYLDCDFDGGFGEFGGGVCELLFGVIFGAAGGL